LRLNPSHSVRLPKPETIELKDRRISLDSSSSDLSSDPLYDFSTYANVDVESLPGYYARTHRARLAALRKRGQLTMWIAQANTPTRFLCPAIVARMYVAVRAHKDYAFNLANNVDMLQKLGPYCCADVSQSSKFNPGFLSLRSNMLAAIVPTLAGLFAA
jgi:hypothetical protein